jgi:predicted heme/steroid binding protein/uncharacterized membrane protein
MKSFTPEELALSDGKDGGPALVVVDGKVYDVSQSKKWPGGQHMRRHQAGRDLSVDIGSAPHGKDLLDRMDVVGEFQTPSAPKFEGLRGKVEVLLQAHPFFRRHPHPAVVHFPVGLLAAAPLLEIAALISGSSATEWASFCCLLIGTISIPAAMGTGYFTWWINYEAAESPIIRKKRLLAWLALSLGIAALCVRLVALSDPINFNEGYYWLYVGFMLLLSATAGYVGFLGGKLTFPYD